MVKHEISNISLFVWYVGCQSHGILGNFAVLPPKSAISQTCQNKFNNLIPPSYGLHFGKYNMGTIGVKYTIFMQKCHVNKIYKYGYCPCYMYIRYSMLVQYQIVHILCLYTNTHSIYIVCLIESYSTLKFTNFKYNFGSSWHIVLMVILSGICHSFWS